MQQHVCGPSSFRCFILPHFEELTLLLHFVFQGPPGAVGAPVSLFAVKNVKIVNNI